MVLYRIVVTDTIVILNAQDLKTWFGLSPGKIPMILGGFMTPAAANLSMVIAIDKDAEKATSGGELVDLGGKNVGGTRANHNAWNILAPSDFAQVSIPMIAPMIVTKQIALITNNSNDSILNLDVVEIDGNFREQDKFESLAERKRMRVQVPGGEFPHEMRPDRIMGDRDPGT